MCGVPRVPRLPPVSARFFWCLVNLDGHVRLPWVPLLCAVTYTDFCPRQTARQLILCSPVTGLIAVPDCGLNDSLKYFDSKYFRNLIFLNANVHHATAKR
jgi:hypothetical protein